MPAGNAPERKLRNLREAISAATYRDEEAAVRGLLSSVDLSVGQRQRIMGRARDLVQACRARSAERSLLDSFLQEFGVSNEEGIALMCLAESLLRIPDARTAEELVADKLASRNWTEHVGASESFFVNASTWALILTGNVLSLSEHITRDAEGWFGGIVSRLGEGVARAGVARAMRILGGGFILGRSIEEALANERGALSSFDMLGEAARTAADAERYLDAYRTALAAIAAAYPAATPTAASGISVKLSALHPLLRQSRRATVLRELSPKIAGLAAEAARANVHLTIDAEEAARLELTLDIFEQLARQDDTAGWQGLGIAVQAYSKRAPAVLDWLAELARATSRRFMVRLVKGAYWDTEIKRAQVGGFEEYPVFTRKASTDLSYIACATKLCRAPDALFPQFATHNAHTLATVVEIGAQTDFEMQRLHGMGELLYDETRRQFPELPSVRVYAPVGEHQDLLPYLVRRLLENGANSSFVNRFLDAEISLNEVVRDPVADVTHLDGIRHPRIALPRNLYGDARTNSEGIDLDHPEQARALMEEMDAFRAVRWGDAGGDTVVNPANRADVVGAATPASRARIDDALQRAVEAQPRWNASPATERAEALLNTARAYEAHRAELAALLVREAGKTVADALAEIREAVDFCRYYAEQCRLRFGQDIALPGPTGESNTLRLHGRGVFACIAPWNFPLAIFTGQVAAALAAGNAVAAKPAEQTPLVARRAIELMLEGGVPGDVLHLLPGRGEEVGQALVEDARITGVAFTGSTATARAIHRTLAARPGPIVPLIAETGGQNAMLVDSTALLEQAVDDIVRSAFGSAGQRCSALRVLYVQEDIAERLLDMLAGAMDVLRIGDPWDLATDVGPVINGDARAALDAHAGELADRRLHGCALPAHCSLGTFVAPQLFEIESVADLNAEHFGPLLHVVRFPATGWHRAIADIRASGFGLTLGVQSRIGRRAEEVAALSRVGNLYVNRDMVGAVVGTQPFGGEGLSGTGPKAGGPNYLPRFAVERVVTVNTAATGGNTDLLELPP